jgi:hypothetical protein
MSPQAVSAGIIQNSAVGIQYFPQNRRKKDKSSYNAFKLVITQILKIKIIDYRFTFGFLYFQTDTYKTFKICLLSISIKSL